MVVLLSVSNVKKAFGPDEILTGVTFRLDPRERVALVGRNGAGKTTLLKILTGQYEPDTGSVTLSRGAKIGYLRQEQPVTLGRSVIEEAQAGTEERLALQVRLRELEEIMHADKATPEDLEEYALVHEHFLESEGYSVERDVRTVLVRMGFEESEFDKPTNALSGGEKTRLAIARLLLEEPDLLILDEPTNHLDLQATEWLEGWIRAYHGAILLVSHDRTFLEATAQRVLDMNDGTVRAWPGPFQKFLELKKEDEERQAEVARRQDQEIAKLDEYVRRFMNSQRTAQARGRLKLMERLISEKVDAPKNDRQMAGGFGDAKRSGDIVLETKKLTVGYPDLTLIKDLDWVVRIGERWGVIGENGAGKSSLIQTCMREIEALSGISRLGSNVVAGYFTQDASDLDPEISPIDTLTMVDGMQPPDARNLLGRFLISGDDVYRPVRTMSGGEKNKLSLARLTNLNPNLLVLDEPTNHLDMASREALAQVLKDFAGTLILISHDRYLLGAVTDHTLDVRKSGPVQYNGSYSEYRESQRRSTPSVQSKTAAKVVEAPTLTPREISKAIERLKREVDAAENGVTAKEAELVQLENRLANLGPKDDVVTLSQRHHELRQEVADAMNAWEAKVVELEEMEAKQGEPGVTFRAR
ncbi:MAG: ATP-binding cassette domain-containing protein [Armatimonadetes bacterium]|nr:ATP-binding cassette domain-containing protein [Armatimonadota bacterium]